MKYKFPHIRNIKDVLPHIAGRKEFVVAERDGYTVINYVVAMEDTFPPVKSEADAILRECRGIIFNSLSGNIISRRYHKFFNAGEREETGAQFVNLSEPHVLLEKLDGSMITPIPVGAGVRWGTKMGVTDVALPVEEWVIAHPHYEEFAKLCFAQGLTPIFEWCSRKQKIVVDYPEDRLVLTALREAETGRYVSYTALVNIAKLHKLDYVKAYESAKSVAELVASLKDKTDFEGYVVRFDDGHMVKVKCDWYLQLHRAKDIVRFEKNVLEIVLEDKVDDLIPLLQPDEAKQVREYQRAVWDGVDAITAKLNWMYGSIGEKMKSKEKREFAVHHVKPLDKQYHGFMFGMWDGKEPRDLLVAELKKSCSSQNRVENCRWMMNGAVLNTAKGAEE